MIPGAHLRQGVNKNLRALPPHAPPDEHDDLLVRGRKLGAERGGLVRRELEIELLCVDAVVDDVYLIRRDLQRVLDFALHKAGADDDAPRLADEIMLDMVNIARNVGVDAVVAPELGGMDGRQEGQLES